MGEHYRIAKCLSIGSVNILAFSVNHCVVSICRLQVTIEDLLRHNIRQLLYERGMKPAELVRMVAGTKTRTKTDSWLSRILNPPINNPKEKRGMRLPDVERVAKVFGLGAHELLNPGISRYTERRRQPRRILLDRRSGKERRLGKELAQPADRSAARTATHGSPFATRPLSEEFSPNVQQHVSALDQAVHDEETAGTRRQTPASRPVGAKKTPSDRRARKPDAG